VKIAFIGCGNISEYHAPAMKAAGFDIAAVCSRPGSARPHEFARRHGVPHVYPDAESLFESRRDWDALLIAVPPAVALPALQRAIALQIPTLVEKPVCTHSVELVPFLGGARPIIVGYNRRFYAPVQALRSFVASSGGPFLGHMLIPETFERSSEQDPAGVSVDRFMSNSVHALDILRYVFGPLELVHREQVRVDRGTSPGFAATLLATHSGTVIHVTTAWNTPANFSLSLYRGDARLLLEPFERTVVFHELKRVEPTPEHPIRRYVPVPAREIGLDPVDQQFKPGFVQQAWSLRELVLGSTRKAAKPSDAATLEDAYQTLRLAEAMVDSFSRSHIRPASDR